MPGHAIPGYGPAERAGSAWTGSASVDSPTTSSSAKRVSKPLFRTKEAQQLATVATAGEVFAEAVVAPAVPHRRVPRLRALIDRWIDDAAQPLFPGGCFWGANLPIFDGRPGPVRDTLRQQRRGWLHTLAREFEIVAATRRRGSGDTDLAVFQIDAVLNAATIALRLDEPNSVEKLHRVVDGLLGPGHSPAGTDSPREGWSPPRHRVRNPRFRRFPIPRWFG
ncbi:TetR family transcriptional regulator C-terminal domain-containing protein [Nocardia grenadensis]|uniref:TetR family transcriptional regulator C-terminal domain-containing protein n=1 Tax=Nocardia grenadensis TaxID=931537 RepID=UPI003D8A8F25